MPAFSGAANNTGKLAAFDSTNTTGSMSCGNKFSGIQFTPQATSFVIPGLGALFTPLDLDSSKKISVSLPLKTRASATVGPSVAQVEQKADGGAAREQTDLHLSPPKLVSSSYNAAATEVKKSVAQGPASFDAPITPKKLQATTSPPGVSKESEYVRPSGSPPVWIEKQMPRTFKPLRAQSNYRSFETFDGAHAILSGMNPDHYAMPYGVSPSPHTSPSLYTDLVKVASGRYQVSQSRRHPHVSSDGILGHQPERHVTHHGSSQQP